MESSLPNTPDPFLVELAEESTYAYQMTYARLPGGESDTDGQVTWYRSGVSGEFFNGILRASFAEERLDESIQGALAPFRSRNLSMRWYIGPSSQPPGLERGLIRCGMRFSWSGPALAAALDDLRAPEKRAEGLACERVGVGGEATGRMSYVVGKLGDHETAAVGAREQVRCARDAQ